MAQVGATRRLNPGRRGWKAADENVRHPKPWSSPFRPAADLRAKGRSPGKRTYGLIRAPGIGPLAACRLPAGVFNNRPHVDVGTPAGRNPGTKRSAASIVFAVRLRVSPCRAIDMRRGGQPASADVRGSPSLGPTL